MVRDVTAFDLFGQDQFAVAGEAKAIFGAVMQQHRFTPAGQKLANGNAANLLAGWKRAGLRFAVPGCGHVSSLAGRLNHAPVLIASDLQVHSQHLPFI